MLKGAKGKLAQVVLLTFILFTANGCDYFRKSNQNNNSKAQNCTNNSQVPCTCCGYCGDGYCNTKMKSGRKGNVKSKTKGSSQNLNYICSCCCDCCDYGCCVCCSEAACCCCGLSTAPGGYPASCNTSKKLKANTAACTNNSCYSNTGCCNTCNSVEACCSGCYGQCNSANCAYRSSPRSSYQRSSYKQRSRSNNSSSCNSNCGSNSNNNSKCQSNNNSNTSGRY